MSSLRVVLVLGSSCVLTAVALAQGPGAGSRSHVRAVPIPAVSAAGPGTAVGRSKISNLHGSFRDTLDDFDGFGWSSSALGDVDGDGVGDLAVGYRESFDGLQKSGGLWVLFLEPDGTVRTQQRIDSREGGFEGPLQEDAFFGFALAALGDLDGNGASELAVGSWGDNDGGFITGAVWVLFLERDGTVLRSQKLSQSQGGIGGVLTSGGNFGWSLANLGDLDGDGRVELAVGAPLDPGGGFRRGAAWIVSMNSDGTAHATRRIAVGTGAFSGPLDDLDLLGESVARVGDLDGDGVPELALGAGGDDDGGDSRGAVWILFLAADGSVKSQQKLSDLAGSFGGVLANSDRFGAACASLGDLDGNGREELAVGTPRARGAFWVLFLAADGTVDLERKIGPGQGGFSGTLAGGDEFGRSFALLGDLDGDARPELAVGASGFDGGSFNGGDRGAVWMLSLLADGRVAANHDIAEGRGGFPLGTLDQLDSFGGALLALGDLDGDGHGDLLVGAAGDDDGRDPGTHHANLGALWVLFLDADGAVARRQKISATAGGFAGPIEAGDGFGAALADLGDLDGDGRREIAVGAPGDDDLPFDYGAVWILSLSTDGTVTTYAKISKTQGGYTDLERDEGFGGSLASLGDLDGDGVPELVAGKLVADDGGQNHGLVVVLFLNADGTVKRHQTISDVEGGLGVTLETNAVFGAAVTGLGDLDGDGVPDLAVGAPGEGGGTPFGERGNIYVLFLNTDGTVRAHQRIGNGQGGLVGTLALDDAFGSGLCLLGDLDRDGRRELAVGANGFFSGAAGGGGAAWILFLASDGRVTREVKLGNDSGGFGGGLENRDAFGDSLAALGDFDGDGVEDLAVGAPADDDGGDGHGAVWLVALDGIGCLDFEVADDLARTPLTNGRELDSPGEFSRVVELSFGGANLGPAIFDSRPGGPNDPSQDRDLLVGLGNVAILQNSLVPTQTVLDVFDRPNDDQDGGSLVFRFPRPIAALSLDLIDIDLGATQQAQVTLIDEAGATRSYAIPAGFTEDLLTHGGPAWRTLDLTTLAPQAGFLASATASESVGFEASAVVRIEVLLGSSGALDNLCFDPHPDSLASTGGRDELEWKQR